MRRMIILIVSAAMLLCLNACHMADNISNLDNIDSHCETIPGDEHLYSGHAAGELNQHCSSPNFGGAFGTESGCIVFLLDVTDEETIAEIFELSSYDHIIKFEKCEFSLKYLEGLSEKILQLLRENKSSEYYWISREISENKIKIYLSSEDEKFKETILKLDTHGGGNAIEVLYKLPWK